MAEIRKHQPTVDNAIDEALLKALGEPVKHVQPGEKPAPTKRAESTPHIGITDLHLGGGSWVQLQQPSRQTDEARVEPPVGEES